MISWLPRALFGAICSLMFCCALHSFSQSSQTIFSNGLVVTCISNMHTTTAMVGLEVQAGYWQDPVLYTGVAELVTQLMIRRMGTQKPECSSVLVEPGRTCYFFSTTHQELFSVLQKLVEGCVQPFNSAQEVADALLEIQKKAKQIKQTKQAREHRLLELSADPQHAFAQERFGGLNTPTPPSLDTLSKWKAHYYRPEKMRLVVQAGLPLPDIVKSIEELFNQSNLKTTQQRSLEQELRTYLSSDVDGFAQDKWQGRVSCMSSTSQPTIMLAWEIAGDPHRSLMPLAKHLTDLLNEQGESSLYADYAKKGWVTDCYNHVECLPNQSLLFTSKWMLSQKGLQHDTEVVQGVIEALKRLKMCGIPLYYIQEHQTQSELKVLDISLDPVKTFQALFNQPKKEFNHKDCAAYSMSTWRALCAQLGPETMHVVKSYPQECFKNRLSETDCLSGISYTNVPFSKKERQKWVNAPAAVIERIPPPNPWMPRSALIQANEYAYAIPQLDRVEKVMHSPYGSFYHLEIPSKDFRAAWCMRWQFGLCDLDPLDRLYRKLLIKALRLSTASRIEQAKKAGIYTECIEEEDVFCVEVFGYPERLLDYLNSWVEDLFLGDLQENDFNQAKEQLLKTLQQETLIHHPHQLLDQLFEKELPLLEQRKVLKQLTFEQFRPHLVRLLAPQSVDLIGACSSGSHKNIEWWNALQQRVQSVKCIHIPTLAHTSLHEEPSALELRVPQEGHHLIWMIDNQKLKDVALEQTIRQLEAFLTEKLIKEENLVQSITLERMDYQDSVLLVCHLYSSLARPQELLMRLERCIEHFIENVKLETRPVEAFQSGAQSPIEACRLIREMVFKKGWVQRDLEAVMSSKEYACQVKSVLGVENKKRMAFLFQGRSSKDSCTYRTACSWKGLWKAYKPI